MQLCLRCANNVLYRVSRFASLPALSMLLKLCYQRWQSHFTAFQTGFKAIQAGGLKHSAWVDDISAQQTRTAQAHTWIGSIHASLGSHVRFKDSKTEKRTSPSRLLKGMGCFSSYFLLLKQSEVAPSTFMVTELSPDEIFPPMGLPDHPSQSARLICLATSTKMNEKCYGAL